MFSQLTIWIKTFSNKKFCFVLCFTLSTVCFIGGCSRPPKEETTVINTDEDAQVTAQTVDDPAPFNIVKPLQPLLPYSLPINTSSENSESVGDCDTSPAPYTSDLLFPSKYEGSSSARDELNLTAEQEYETLTAPIKELENLAVKLSDAYRGGDVHAKTCLIQTLNRWAVNHSMLHPEVNHVGQAVRKWALATITHSYLKLISPSNAEPIDELMHDNITVWFLSLALEVQAYYSNREAERVNNHDYWAAWAVMNVALVLNNAVLFEWSLSKFDEAMSMIDKDGYLPSEMKRKTRALSYHNYAIQPLVFIAAVGEANDYKTFSRHQEKFQKLVLNVVTGIANPKIFAELSGSEQVIDGLETSYSLAWMEVWALVFPQLDGIDAYLKELRPMRSTRLGGNLTRVLRGEDYKNEKSRWKKLRILQ